LGSSSGRQYSMQYGMFYMLTPMQENIQGDTKKRELLKNPIKIVEIQQKKFIHRN
jgi:hypothetical protein